MGCLKLTYYDEGVRLRPAGPDPLAEKYSSYSPYNYVLNNPVRYIDPDGRAVEDAGLNYPPHLWKLEEGDDGNAYFICRQEGTRVLGETDDVLDYLRAVYDGASSESIDPGMLERFFTMFPDLRGDQIVTLQALAGTFAGVTILAGAMDPLLGAAVGQVLGRFSLGISAICTYDAWGDFYRSDRGLGDAFRLYYNTAASGMSLFNPYAALGLAFLQGLDAGGHFDGYWERINEAWER